MDARKSEEVTKTTSEATSENFSNMVSNENDMEGFVEDLRSGFFEDIFKAFPPVLDTIYFEGNMLAELNCDDIKKFASLFEKSNIRKLYLGNNSLGLLTAEKIVALFSGFKNLEELHLNNNLLSGMGTDNFKLFFDCLKNTNIKVLDLNNNFLRSLGREGLFILRNGVINTCIQILDISDNGFKELLPKKIFETMKDKWSKKYGVDRSEFESKIKEAEKLEAFIELARLAASEVEWLLPTGTVKPDNLNPSTLEKIGNKLQKGVNTVKRSFRGFYMVHEAKKIISDTHHFEQEKHKLIAETTIQDLQKNLAKNRLRHGGNYSLKELCIFTIHNQGIPWKEAALPVELKDELENNSCGMKI